MTNGEPKILIVKLSAIGDVVHTLPALNALRRFYPHAHITWLVEEAAADLVMGHEALDRVLISKRKHWVRGLKTARWQTNLDQLKRFVSELRDTRYDMLFDFQAALKGAALIALTRAQRKIGFGRGLQHQEHSYIALNERIPAVSMEIHALKRGLMLLNAVGIPCEKIEYHMPVTQGHMRRAQDLMHRTADRRANDLAIAINPMAKWPTKLWPEANFAELADRLIADYHARVYFTGGPEDRPVIAQIRSAMHGKAFNLAGRTSLMELAAIYRAVDCVISTDTGPMHISAAVGTPTAALFGPTADWRTGPYGDGHHIISTDPQCRPCFKRTCNTTHCMRDIGVDDVLRHVSLMLKK